MFCELANVSRSLLQQGGGLVTLDHYYFVIMAAN